MREIHRVSGPLIEPTARRAYVSPAGFIDANSPGPTMRHSSAIAAYARYILAEAFIPELPGRYRGKVRENYDLANGTRFLIATDRISAFDRILAAIPLKGLVLTQTARFWFEATNGAC